MKTELENQDKTEIVKQTEIQKQKVLLGNLKLNKGHKLFEYNMETQQIKPAVFDSQEINITDLQKGFYEKKKKITINEKCIYIGALNKTNVLKILKNKYRVTIN